jgi:hypothetical protein
MAPKADDDHSTAAFADSWWFLNPELSELAKPALAFVAQWTWSEKAAKEFLWEAMRGTIRWYAESEIIQDNPVFTTRAGLLTLHTAVNQGLWHPDYFTMDWETSRGIYAGPAILLIRNPECPEQTAVKYDGRASVRIVARLMRFHRGDMVRELCRRGLMPASPAPFAASTPKVSPSKPSTQVPAEPEPQGHQITPVIQWLRKNRPPDGKTPHSESAKVLLKAMEVDPEFIREHADKSLPSSDVVERAVRYLGRID